MRAMVHYGERRFDDALADIEILLEENPDDPETEPLRDIRDRLRAMKKK